MTTQGHFGIDSAAFSTGYYDQAVAAFGKPEFIGRYLPVYALTPEERDFIHGKGAAILALWNRDQSGAMIGSGDVQAGKDEAAAACAAWGTIGLPKGCAIFTDVENNMWLSGAALQGWIEGCHVAGYVAGVYLNPPNGRNHAAGYQWAREQTQGLPCVQFTSQNELYANQDKPQHVFLVDGSHASSVPGYEGECVTWQTWENSLNQTVDLDCASDVGFALMWHATPPAPPKPKYPYAGMVKVRSALKAADEQTKKPSHATPTAIDEKHRPVVLEIGAVILITGDDVITDDDWVPCKLPAPSQVHGFLPKSAVK